MSATAPLFLTERSCGDQRWHADRPAVPARPPGNFCMSPQPPAMLRCFRDMRSSKRTRSRQAPFCGCRDRDVQGSRHNPGLSWGRCGRVRGDRDSADDHACRVDRGQPLRLDPSCLAGCRNDRGALSGTATAPLFCRWQHKHKRGDRFRTGSGYGLGHRTSGRDSFTDRECNLQWDCGLCPDRHPARGYQRPCCPAGCVDLGRGLFPPLAGAVIMVIVAPEIQKEQFLA